MTMTNEDLRIVRGGLDNENEMPVYEESPTWIVDEAWDQVKEVCERSLEAYMDYCTANNIPHSYLLGLDVVITGEIDPDDPNHIIDIRPTIMEGPCCNSYPGYPNIDSYRLYKRALAEGKQPDIIEYTTHPTMVTQTLVDTLIQIYRFKGGKGMPRIGIFTRPYPESEEETAHRLIHAALLMNYVKAYRITPEENPEIRDGKIWVSGVPMDLCFRRIERIHVPLFYGKNLGERIINETPDTIWVNAWPVDDLRSKTLEERVFRNWEEKTSKTISRGKTLIGSEITPDGVRDLANRGGYVIKKWNSTGGKGVFLHVNHGLASKAMQYLYERYDGRHMVLLEPDQLEKSLQEFAGYEEDASLQQLRLIDARALTDGKLVYDIRINVLYQPEHKNWKFLSGISRVVKCGKQVTKGNSLLTNICSGAEIAPIIFGYLKDPVFRKEIALGPMLAALMNKQPDIYI